MSRSYKHYPYAGDNKGKAKKRMANHKVRNYLKKYPDALFQKKKYKKMFESYDICDYSTVKNFDEYWAQLIEFWEWRECHGFKNSPYPNKEQAYKEWYKYYKMK